MEIQWGPRSTKFVASDIGNLKPCFCGGIEGLVRDNNVEGSVGYNKELLHSKYTPI